MFYIGSIIVWMRPSPGLLSLLSKLLGMTLVFRVFNCHDCAQILWQHPKFRKSHADQTRSAWITKLRGVVLSYVLETASFKQKYQRDLPGGATWVTRVWVLLMFNWDLHPGFLCRIYTFMFFTKVIDRALGVSGRWAYSSDWCMVPNGVELCIAK